MTFSPPTPTDLLAQRVQQRQALINQAHDLGVPSVAEAIGRDARAYPWLQPDLRVVLAQSGAPVDVRDQVAQSAAQGMMQDPAYQAATEPAAPKKPKKFSWSSPMDYIKGAVRWGSAAAAAPYEVLNNAVLGSVNAIRTGSLSPLDNVIKGTTLSVALNRTFGSDGESGGAGTGWFVSKGTTDRQAELARQIRGTDSQGRAWTAGRAVMSPFTSESSGVNLFGGNRAAANVAEGLVDAIAAVELDPIQTARAARAPIEAGELSAKTRGAGIVGNAILDRRKAALAERVAQVGSIGEEAARTAGEVDSASARALQLAERLKATPTPMAPSATGYEGVLSNLVRNDAQRTADVAAEQLRLAAAGKAKLRDLADQAENISGIDAALNLANRRDPEYAKTVYAALGLADNPKWGRGAVVPQAMKGLLSPGGQRVVETLAEEQSPTRIMAMFKGKLPVATAVKLAEAPDAAGVVTELGKALSIEGGLRKLPELSRFGGVYASSKIGGLETGLGDTLAYNRRLFGHAPSAADATLDLSNPEQAFQRAFDLLGTAKITGERRAQLIDPLLKALAEDNPGAIYNAARADRTLGYTKRLAADLTERIGSGELVGNALTDAQRQLDEINKGIEVAESFGSIRGAIAQQLKDVTYSRIAEQLGDRLGDTAIGRQVRKLVNPDDLNFLFHDAKRAMDDVSLYTGVPMTDISPEFDNFVNGPLLWDQLVDNKIHLMNGDKIDELATRMSNAARVVWGTPLSGRRMPLTMLKAFQNDVFRPLVIMRPALAVRMLMEEGYRMSAGGAFRGTGDWISALARGGETVDALGAHIDAANLMPKLERALEEAHAAGNAEEVARIGAQLRVNAKSIEDGMRTVGEATVGRRRPGFIGSMEARFGSSEDYMHGSGHWTIADLNDQRQAERHAKGLIDELNQIAADPVAKRAVMGGLLPGDQLATRAVAAGDVTTTDDIVEWLTEGSGQRFWRDYAASKGKALDDRAFADQWVRAQQAYGRYLFGNSPEAMDAIATGMLGESRLANPTQWGKTEVTAEMKAWAKAYQESGNAPAKVKYEMTLHDLVRDRTTEGKRAVQTYKHLLDQSFVHLYSNKSDELYRVPMFAERYWQNMEHLMPNLTREAALEAAANAARNPALDKTLVERLQTIAATASGSSELEHADQLAKGWALDDVRKLFYKADRESNAMQQARLVFPFAHAYAEMLTTYGRIAMQDPAGTLRSLSRATGAIEDVADAHGSEGFFHKDQAGNTVFTIPGSGKLIGYLTGVNADFTGRVKDLNIVGSVMPGIGPVASIPAWWVTQNAPGGQGLADVLFPYGKPKGLLDAATPSWVSKIRSGMSQDEAEQVYGNTFFRTAQALLASGKYGSSPEDRVRLMADAKSKARGLTILRGLVQAFSPAAPSVDYQSVDKAGGDVAIWKMREDYSKMIEDPKMVRDAGYSSPEEMFLDQYGDRNLAYLVARTVNQHDGVSLTDQFSSWLTSEDGRHAKATFPTVFGYFGPQGGAYSSSAMDTIQGAGLRPNKTGDQLIAEANNKIAANIWREKIAEADTAIPRPTAAQRKALDAWKAEFKQQLQLQYPGWDPTAAGQMTGAENTLRRNQLMAAAADPTLGSTPTGQALQAYFHARASASAAAKEHGGSLASSAHPQYADWLEQYAVNLAHSDAGFASAWEDVLRWEFPGTKPAKTTTGGK